MIERGAIYLKPGAEPEVQSVPADLASLQRLVEGNIEFLSNWLADFPQVVAYGNDEARLLGMPPCVFREWDKQVITGPVIFVGDDGKGEERALTEDEEAALLKYLRKNRLSPAVPGDRVRVQLGPADTLSELAQVLSVYLVDDEVSELFVAVDLGGKEKAVRGHAIKFNEGWQL